MKRFEITYIDYVWAENEAEAVEIAADAIRDGHQFREFSEVNECEDKDDDLYRKQ
jgi:hypothetical protein